MVHYDKKPSRVDTEINYTHIGLFATTIFAIGAAYGNVNAKIDKVLALIPQVELIDKRTSAIEKINQSQEYINKSFDERFIRDEDNVKNFIEQRPHNQFLKQ